MEVIAVCFPASQTDSVDRFLNMRGVYEHQTLSDLDIIESKFVRLHQNRSKESDSNYDKSLDLMGESSDYLNNEEYQNLLDLITSDVNVEKVDGEIVNHEDSKAELYLFDFINEIDMFSLIMKYREDFCRIHVISTKKQVVTRYEKITEDVYFIRPLEDFSRYFWMNKAFRVDNIRKSLDNGINIMDIRELDLNYNGNDIQQVSIDINAGTKIIKDELGRKISVETLTVRGKGKCKRLTFKEKLKSIVKKNIDLKILNDNGNEDGISNSILSTINNLDFVYVGTISELMKKNGLIDNSQFEALYKFEKESNKGDYFGVTDKAIDLGLIGEMDGIDLVREMTQEDIKTKSEVDSMEVSDELPLSYYLASNSFIIRTSDKEVKYAVVGLNNRKARSILSSKFNDIEFCYSKEEYIKYRLESEEKIREAKRAIIENATSVISEES